VRQSSDQSAKADAWLYQPAPAYRVHAGRAPKSAPTSGQNPPPGAILYVALKAKPKDATLEILDSAGNLVRRYSSSEMQPLDEPLDPDDEKPKKQLELKPGINRFVWDLRYEGAPRVPDYYLYEYGAGAKGPLALPGKYEVKLTVDGKTFTSSLEIKPDPRLNVPRADLERQFSMLMEIQQKLTAVYNAANRIIDLRKRVGAGKEAQALDEKLAALQDHLLNMRITANEDSLAYPLGVDGSLAALAIIVGGDSDSAPNDAAVQQFEKVKAEADQYLARWSAMQADVAVGIRH
jgi:hypothetical protein